MRERPTTSDTRIQEYWEWFAVSLFLLITVDLLTTFGATVAHGIEAESNPLMRWLLLQGPVVITVANLVVLVVAVYCFSSVITAVERSPEPYDRYLRRVVEVWLGLLLAMGLFVFANNLSVVVLGESLL